MPKLKTIADLVVWQKSMELVLLSYRACEGFPAEERFALVSQIRRAATSVPANIAEGFGRWNRREFARFLAISSGSLRELETHFLISQRLGYISPTRVSPILEAIDEVARITYAMISKIKAKESATTKKPIAY
jgi:four helix bundle protein